MIKSAGDIKCQKQVTFDFSLIWEQGKAELLEDKPNYIVVKTGSGQYNVFLNTGMNSEELIGLDVQMLTDGTRLFGARVEDGVISDRVEELHNEKYRNYDPEDIRVILFESD